MAAAADTPWVIHLFGLTYSSMLRDFPFQAHKLWRTRSTSQIPDIYRRLLGRVTSNALYRKGSRTQEKTRPQSQGGRDHPINSGRIWSNSETYCIILLHWKARGPVSNAILIITKINSTPDPSLPQCPRLLPCSIPKVHRLVSGSNLLQSTDLTK